MEALDSLIRSGKVRYVGRLELRRLAADEGAGRRRPPRWQRFVDPADPLHAAGARGRVRAGADRASTRASASSSGARSPAASCPASTAAASTSPRARASSATGTSRRSTTPRRSTTSSTSLVEIGEAHGVSAAQVALAWLLKRPGVCSVIVGARTDEQLRRQPGRRRAGALGRRARAPRADQPAAAALPLLAPGEGGRRPPRPGRPHVARALPLVP